MRARSGNLLNDDRKSFGRSETHTSSAGGKRSSYCYYVSITVTVTTVIIVEVRKGNAPLAATSNMCAALSAVEAATALSLPSTNIFIFRPFRIARQPNSTWHELTVEFPAASMTHTYM